MGMGWWNHASKVALALPTPIKYENEWREMGCDCNAPKVTLPLPISSPHQKGQK